MDNFDLRKHLVENKLTAGSRLAEGKLTNEGIFGTSPEKEKLKVENALDRWVKYSMENGDSEEDVLKMGSKYLRDSIDAYLGSKIDSDELDKMYDDPNEPVIWKV